MKKFLLSQVLLALFFIGCSSDDAVEEVTVNAMVVNAGGGPCAFLIQPEGSETYLFGEIPTDFQVDDLPVVLTYKSTSSEYSCSGFLSATVIEIIDIEMISIASGKSLE